MRLSTDQDDAGYRAWRKLPRSVKARVLLDGVEVSRCVTADTKRGFVLVHATDVDGRVMLNARRTDTKRQRLYGRVTIEMVRR